MTRRLLRRKNAVKLSPVRDSPAANVVASVEPVVALSGNTRPNGLLAARPALTLGTPVQAKLDVGPVDDPLEREADAAAELVTRAPDGAAPPGRFTRVSDGWRIQRDAPAAQPVTEEDRREFEAMQTEFFSAVGERMSEDILGQAGFAQGPGGSRQRPTTADEALQVTAMWGVTRDSLLASLPNLGQSLQGQVAAGSHGSDTLAAEQQTLIDAMTPAGQQAYAAAIARVRQEPFWRSHLDTTTIFIYPDMSGANRYAGYTQRGTERDVDGNESTAYVIHISKDALEAGNLDSVVANLVHELSHTLDVGEAIGPSLGPFLQELAGLLADHPDVVALRQGAADAGEARTTHVNRIRQVLYEHTGYGETEVFVHLQQLTHQPSVTVDGDQVTGSRYILATVEGYIRQLQQIGINPRTLNNILDALGRRTTMLYDRRIAATTEGTTMRQRLVREKELAELTLKLARDFAQEEPEESVQPKLEPSAEANPLRRSSLQREPASASAAGGPAPPAVHDVLRSPGRPLDPATRTLAEPRFGRDFGDVRVHTDPGAARSAQSIRAKAYTSGNNIVFAAGQYAPHTDSGRRLLTHELTHVVQQSASQTGAVQRDVVEMPAETIRSSRNPVEKAVPGLGQLQGQGVTTGGLTLAHGAQSITQNAPNPADVLPFLGGGWDGDAILTKLGQYDTIAGTDSDALRCVQAVAMASRIPRGPAIVVQFLRSMILEGMMSRSMGKRERTAIDVLEHVIARIEDQRATFGDLLWAQEAMHDLFYNDVTGTPAADIRGQMAPVFDLQTSLQRLDIWCDNPAEVIAQANTLQPGEQLLVNTWQVVFNVAFDDLSDQGIEVAEGDSIVVSVNNRRVRIRRINTDKRLSHTVIDPIVRDRQLGHQLLVFKDGATGKLRLYEPEITVSGQHLETLAQDGSNFTRYFADQPTFGIYNYIQILGKLTPSALSTMTTTP